MVAICFSCIHAPPLVCTELCKVSYFQDVDSQRLHTELQNVFSVNQWMTSWTLLHLYMHSVISTLYYNWLEKIPTYPWAVKTNACVFGRKTSVSSIQTITGLWKGLDTRQQSIPWHSHSLTHTHSPPGWLRQSDKDLVISRHLICPSHHQRKNLLDWDWKQILRWRSIHGESPYYEWQKEKNRSERSSEQMNDSFIWASN